VIGAGAIARQHLLCLRELPDADVVAVCDRSPAVAEAAAERYGIPRHYVDHAELLADARPDVVHVTTPVTAHKRIALDALAAGAHVLVEKPITTSYEDTRTLLEAGRAARGRLVENYNYVHNPEVQRVLGLVRAAELGEVRRVDIELDLDLLAPGSAFADGAHPSASMPGGAIADFLPHLASLAHAFVGEHGAVRAVWRQDPGSPLAADEFGAIVEGERATASLAFSARAQPDAFRLRAHGTLMRAHVNLFEPRLFVERTRDAPGPVGHMLNGLADARSAGATALAGIWRKASGDPGTYRGLWALVGKTYRALADGAAPPVTLDQVASVNRLVAELTREASR
jgi:predicted dehydrogenase